MHDMILVSIIFFFVAWMDDEDPKLAIGIDAAKFQQIHQTTNDEDPLRDSRKKGQLRSPRGKFVPGCCCCCCDCCWDMSQSQIHRSMKCLPDNEFPVTILACQNNIKLRNKHPQVVKHTNHFGKKTQVACHATPQLQPTHPSTSPRITDRCESKWLGVQGTFGIPIRQEVHMLCPEVCWLRLGSWIETHKSGKPESLSMFIPYELKTGSYTW